MENKLNSQERILAIIKTLSKNHYSWLRVKDLSKILKTTETNICRDVAILESFNFIQTTTPDKSTRRTRQFFTSS